MGDTNTADNIETKGVKAHFALDDSGILVCTNVESVFEKTISVEEQEKREKEWKDATDGIDWSKLGDNIKSFFGTNEEGKEVSDEKTAEGDEKDKTEEKKGDSKEEKKEDKKENDKKEDSKDSKKGKEKPKEPKKPKVETVKVDLSSVGSRNDVNLLEGSLLESSKSKLAALAKADADR